MRIKDAFVAILLLFLYASASAGPVNSSRAIYTQPDGTSFSVKLAGDEWVKICTTEDGCAIIKDEENWWCYGTYDENGHISSSGYRVGNAPAEIIAASRRIPYSILARKAAERRSVGKESALRTLDGIKRQAATTKSGNTTIQKRGLALLVEFSDIKFKYTKSDFYNLLNQKDYKNSGSAKDYYEDQFGEGWEFIFDVSDIITLDWPSEHYGKNDANKQDSRPWEMVAEACRKADSQIDFSLYDQDSDGEVDNVYVFYAGLSESEHTDQPNLIWPHQYYIYTENLRLDNKRIYRYACSSEISGERSLTGIGSFCHEYGHTFGLVDLYDTDYDEEGGWAAGAWRTTSLMDAGNYNNNSATPPNFNCIEREMLGLSEAITLESGNSYTLEPIHHRGMYYRLDTDTNGEYYLFECRSNEGWDRYVGGKGMLVYHIDKNMKVASGPYSYNIWSMNMVNTIQQHQCADLIEADGRSDAIQSMEELKRDISGIFFPTRTATSLGTDNAPELKFWNGNISQVSITGIKNIDGNIVFNVLDRSKVSGIPSVTNAEFTTFPDAVFISFEASDTTIIGARPVLEWKRTDTDDQYTTVYPTGLGGGKYVCKIEGLTSGNVSYETYIRFENESTVSSTYKLPFMTKRKPGIDWPYIYISNPTIKKGERIILHAVNSVDAAEISWTYNGAAINHEESHCLYPDKSGTLTVTITWRDGSTDTIIKSITVVE